jgi:hypothetical protein
LTDLSINFLSYLENSVALSHISKLHTLLRKLLHTRTHCMSWVIYLNFISAGKFVLIENLTLNYIIAYFLNAIWLLYQLIIHACFEAIFRKTKYFFANFPPVSNFMCEAFGRVRFKRLDSQVTRTDARSSTEGWHSSVRLDGISDASGRLTYRF